MLWEEERLNKRDWMLINEVYHMNTYTIFYNYKEHVFVNPVINGSKELVDIIKKIFGYRCLYKQTEKLFDKVETMTDEQTVNVLHYIWLEWLKKVRKLELNEAAQKILKDVRSNRIYYKARKESEIIKELFYIGFGIYDDNSPCNSQQGAENAFMYGYLMGMNLKKIKPQNEWYKNKMDRKVVALNRILMRTCKFEWKGKL